MYSAIVKNDDQTWDIFFDFNYYSMVRLSSLKEAWDSELPIVPMEITAYKNTALIGASWNGSSFSGGHELDDIHYKALPDTVEFWESHKVYGFLCDNVLIAMIVTTNDTDFAELVAAAFEGEVKFIKHEGLPFGKSIKYNTETRESSLA
jgi:hypothetical protein